MKNWEKVVLIVVVFLFLIAIAGIYRFNFTNDNIYISSESGEIVPYNQGIKNAQNVPKCSEVSDPLVQCAQ